MFKRLIVRYARTIMTLASIVGVISTSTGCRFIGHQPKEPEGLTKMKTNNKQ